MLEPLRTVLHRAEVSEECCFSRDDVCSWTTDEFDGLLASGVLVDAGRASEIDYSGCEQSCRIEGEFVAHPESGETVCLHLCRYGCGLVQLPAAEFDRWRFSLDRLGSLVAKLIGASGEVIEDVRDRVVSLGILGDAARTVEVFLARGLQWPDAATMLQGANRLKTAQNPFVLTLTTPALQNVWPKMNPASAVLLEHLAPASARHVLALDMAPLLSLDSIPHPDASSPSWLTNKAAAIKLQDIVDGLTFAKAKARVSAACSRGDEFRTNGQSGSDLRIEAHSFSTWLLAQRDKNLAEDNDGYGHIEVPGRGAARRSSATRR
ncbi:MAG: hypothetical protein L0219_13875 [Phycisphaerales bacterium]|nr:hypothetical protein [Phycisphaerales bacterium]